MNDKAYEIKVTIPVKYWLNDNDASVLSYDTMNRILRAVANDILDGWITHNEMESMTIRPIAETPWHDLDALHGEARLERYTTGGYHEPRG